MQFKKNERRTLYQQKDKSDFQEIEQMNWLYIKNNKGTGGGVVEVYLWRKPMCFYTGVKDYWQRVPIVSGFTNR